MNAGRASDGDSIRAAFVVLPCAELQPTLDFFVDRLGFRLDRISPADDPRAAEISGHGLRILIRRGNDPPPGILRFTCEDPAAVGRDLRELIAPNGTRIELAEAAQTPEIPAARNELVVGRAGEAEWVTGRAGMRYRDLIPGRLGGRFIASHIQIPEGGPVPDRVHYHAIRFQMIYCAEGWVRLVYEDQGPPFVLAAGDSVLQPPRIRHRVLESSPGLEVIELACPAEHDTFLDHELELPTGAQHAEREFGGQRFVRHQVTEATWQPWSTPGFEYRDLGITAATAGLAGARVVRASGANGPARAWQHGGELLFVYVLAGDVTIGGAASELMTLNAGDSVALPQGREYTLDRRSDDLEILEIRLPGEA